MSFLDTVDAARATEARERTELAAAQLEFDAAVAERTRLEALLVPDFADVSEFQGDISWDKYAAAGALLAGVRVNDGDRRDPRYTAARVASLRAQGLLIMPYAFARVAAPANGERDGAIEAAMATFWAWEMGALRAGDLPLAYDLEKSAAAASDGFNGQTATKAGAHGVRFISAYRALRGHSPILYTNPATWLLIRPTLSAAALAVYASCPLWHAEWGVARPRVLDGLPQPVFHQYRDDARFAGISTAAPVNVDGNRALISRDELAALRI